MFLKEFGNVVLFRSLELELKIGISKLELKNLITGSKSIYKLKNVLIRKKHVLHQVLICVHLIFKLNMDWMDSYRNGILYVFLKEQMSSNFNNLIIYFCTKQTNFDCYSKLNYFIKKILIENVTWIKQIDFSKDGMWKQIN